MAAPLEVVCEISSVGAAYGTNYTLSGTVNEDSTTLPVNLPANQDKVRITMTAKLDDVSDADESVTLTVVEGDDPYTVGANDDAVVAITNIAPPHVSISSAGAFVDEGQAGTITVTRQPSSG